MKIFHSEKKKNEKSSESEVKSLSHFFLSKQFSSPQDLTFKVPKYVAGEFFEVKMTFFHQSIFNRSVNKTLEYCTSIILSRVRPKIFSKKKKENFVLNFCSERSEAEGQALVSEASSVRSARVLGRQKLTKNFANHDDKK